MIGWLMSLFTGGTVNALVQAYAKGKDSAVEMERIQAERAKAQLDSLAAAQRLSNEVRIATSGFLEMRVLAFLIAAPFVIHAGLVGADTSFRLGWGIPAYPKPFDEWEGIILLSFFGVQTLSTGVRAIAAGLIARRGA